MNASGRALLLSTLTEKECGEVEDWHSAVGFEGAYSVSSHGHVRRERATTGTHPGRLLKGSLNGYGYLLVHLSLGNRPQRVAVHRLVAEAFIAPRQGELQVNHKDGDKLHNHPHNLEWVSLVGNVRHAHASRLMPLGNDFPQAKLTADAVREIRAARGVVPQRELARRFGVSQVAVKLAQLGRTWRHVG